MAERERAWKDRLIEEWLDGGSLGKFAERHRVTMRHVKETHAEWLAGWSDEERELIVKERRERAKDRSGKVVVSLDMVRLGQALDRVVRDEKGLWRLADYLGTTTHAVADLLRGQVDVSWSWLDRIGRLLGLSVGELFSDDLVSRINVEVARFRLERETA